MFRYKTVPLIFRRTSVIVIVLLAYACNPAEELPVDTGLAYFPLKVGQWSLYEVDSTRIIQNVSSQFTYQLRTTVVDSFANNSGTFTYVTRREKRNTASSSWSAAGTWTSTLDARQAIVAEGNTRYVKLQFPIEVGLRWNGNQFNAEGGEEQCNGEQCDRYEIVALENQFGNGRVTAGEAVIIQQHDDKDILVKKDIRSEIYVRDIGLVRREINVLEYCTEQDCYGKQFVTSGLVYSMELIDYDTND